MPYPHPRSMSAMCPPCVCLVSALCPPCPPCVLAVPLNLVRHVRLVSALSLLWLSQRSVRHVSAFFPPYACLVSRLVTLICHVSGMCRPPSSRLVSFMCPPRARPSPPTVLGAWPPCVRHVSAMCPPCARSLSAQVHYVSAQASPRFWTLSALGLLWGSAVASSSNKIFRAIAQPAALYCMPAGQFSWHPFWFPKFGLCKRTLCFKKCLGSKSMLV